MGDNSLRPTTSDGATNVGTPVGHLDRTDFDILTSQLKNSSCYKQTGDWKSLWMSTIGLCTEQRLQFVCRKNSAASPKAGPPTSVQANIKSKSQPFQPLSYRVSTFHVRSSHSHRFPFKQVAHPLQKCFFCIVPYPRRGRTRQTQDGKFRISKGKFNMHLMNLMYTNVC